LAELVEVRVPEDIWPRRRDWRGVVVGIRKSRGDRVEMGEVVAEVEIEKAVLEIESPVDGVVESVLVASGDNVSPGDVLMVVRKVDSA